MTHKLHDDIPIETRIAILFDLKAASTEATQHHGTFTQLATMYRCHRTTDAVITMWKRHLEHSPSGDLLSIWLLSLTCTFQTTRLLEASHTPHGCSKDNPALSHQGRHHPSPATASQASLAPKHIKARIAFCLKNKWFRLEKDASRYYLASFEDYLERRIQNKRFIGQVMFLAAVARPRKDVRRNQTFDGKFGIWLFVTQVPARRTSRKRAAGTLETKAVNVGRVAYEDILRNKLNPAIVSKWPRDTKNIRLQQDNALAHVASGKVNAARYLQLLQDEIPLNIMKLALGGDFTWQQDNAPIHKVRIINAFFDEYEVIRTATSSRKP
ncbi:hypothetical protein H257_01576 [Aphanomyces astaci]|uniref:Uncharacterized protein n=1 Tax=Aphanomyces astaci TaxID=112090 RepID=W4HAH5_APHAT|nr:hypothetical protein H257_01576 [Aphanomyces astaci]ETV88284.1 hypothetical protein H257_01576 [Aphanomyces astaci]|eukprot:XP_009823147.1 hypothetical protein H257_01576 [Aphanomyces astaci]